MLTFENILLIIIIFILLVSFNKRSNNDEPFEITKKVFQPSLIPIYGNDQYVAKDKELDDTKFKYQNLDILDLNPTKVIDETMIINEPLKTFDKTPIFDIKYGNKFKNVKLPSEDSDRYDIKFFQPSDADINIPFDPTKTVYTERKIQEVYDDIINNVKKIYPDKKIKKNNNLIINGGFGENILTNVEWSYENENDGMSYDPSLLNLMAL
jgi:hypothetical protein